MKENMDVRVAALTADVPLCMVALHIGVSEGTLMRWMRRPLTAEKKSRILNAINVLQKS